MNTYSRALRHIDMKDVKQKHQQKIIEQKIQEEKKKEDEKYIASLMEKKKYDWRKKLLEDGKKYLEEEPTMSSSGMFQTTLPATGNLQYTISGETVDVVSGGFNITFDSSNIDTFVFIVSLPAGRTATVSSGSNSRTVSSSGTYELSVSQSKTLTVQFRFSAGDGTPSVPDIHGKRLTPINVFVSLDSPEAVSFMRTDPMMANLSPQERLKKLKEMLEASDEYVLKMLGADFPGTGAVLPGEAGDTPGVETIDYGTDLTPLSDNPYGTEVGQIAGGSGQTPTGATKFMQDLMKDGFGDSKVRTTVNGVMMTGKPWEIINQIKLTFPGGV